MCVSVCLSAASVTAFAVNKPEPLSVSIDQDTFGTAAACPEQTKPLESRHQPGRHPCQPFVPHA
eukprot:m.110978 g.110978  ORF g.110978 m.110978 type:complete len:64 (+) comp13416_c1_seq6:2496-2687(+)